ncbi:MAG: cyclic pyranopterin monophosphate synthase MoaC [Bacteroidota bacterium]|jgi:cyclic pyranopterin phosphate synthase
MNKLSHIDTSGDAKMVDVGGKSDSARFAKARALVFLPSQVMEELKSLDFQTKKGSVFQTAIIAGIMGAKKTPELIPLCHPLSLNQVNVEINYQNEHIQIVCTASLNGKTGVEMEALTGASVAALTIYDMCKAMSHEIIIREIKLLEKTGGKNDFKISE